ncbi:unnamed protein product [Paramecium octaurelia]|uniref:Uncharacterized protein n=1 Tax=Paramecium octaurelia TaxID=43137 RepID=A0A8S1UK56_PAROT|nr:unnamed protein product [Paramecium octaurelia]
MIAVSLRIGVNVLSTITVQNLLFFHIMSSNLYFAMIVQYTFITRGNINNYKCRMLKYIYEFNFKNLNKKYKQIIIQIFNSQLIYFNYSQI